MRRLRFFLPAVVILFAACNEASRPAAPDAAANTDTVLLTQGCYLGHPADSSDTVQLRIERITDGTFEGSMRIALREKDQRSGRIEGRVGTDGICRGVFRYMQEGMRDSLQLQFRAIGSGSPALELRPAAYDATGREYPDSTKPFSLRLNTVPCEGDPAAVMKPL